MWWLELRWEKTRRSRDISMIAIFAALYAVLVVAFAPISFHALQFRVAGILRPAIVKKWSLSIGYAIGVFVSNLFSPFAGTRELLFMPVMSFVAGLCGYLVGRLVPKWDYYVCGVVIAVIIPLSVSYMLYQLFELPMYVTFPMILASEQIINSIGASIFKALERRYVWWK